MKTIKQYVDIESDNDSFILKVRRSYNKLQGIGEYTAWLIAQLAFIVTVGSPIFASIVFIIYGKYLIGVLALLSAFCIAVDFVVSSIQEDKYFKVNSFVIDEKGIVHTTHNKKYFIDWSELSSFGFVNNKQIIDGLESKRENYQMCAYFSKKVFSKNQLKRVIWRRRYQFHYSKKNILVLEFAKNEIEDSIMQKIHDLVEKYCVECYRIDLIEELWWASDVES